MSRKSMTKNNYWELDDDIDKVYHLDMMLDGYVITCTSISLQFLK